jgi:F-type H+-transporting ATPase subunit gamma
VAVLRDLNRRIRSVKNTQQITKAMEMVAAAKLRRAQERVGAARPYAEKLNQVLSLLAGSESAAEHPFFEKRDGNREAIVVLTSDRGLCGAFNATVCRTVERYVGARPRNEVSLIAVGRKGNQYFRHRGWKIDVPFVGVGDQVDYAMVTSITRAAIDLFLERRVDRVTVVATEFISATRRRVEPISFLPIGNLGDSKSGVAPGKPYIFEPSEEEIFAELLPRYTNALFYSVLAGSFAAEHSARMVAMGNASRNAKELIEALTLTRNRLRQAAITSELADIVGAVEALS